MMSDKHCILTHNIQKYETFADLSLKLCNQCSPFYTLFHYNINKSHVVYIAQWINGIICVFSLVYRAPRNTLKLPF